MPIKLVDARSPDGSRNKNVLFPVTEEMVHFIADENPFEYSEEDLSKSHLLALRFGGRKEHMYSQVMILKLVFGKSNMYERLGIAECPHWWFGGQAKRIVELV